MTVHEAQLAVCTEKGSCSAQAQSCTATDRMRSANCMLTLGAGNDESVLHADPAHHIAALHQEGQVGLEDVVQDAVMSGARS